MVRASVLLVCLVLTGCGESPVWLGPPAPPPATETAASGVGRVSGRVYGVGAIPGIDDFRTVFVSADFRPVSETRPNPLRPRVRPADLAVAGAWVSSPTPCAIRDADSTLDIHIDDDRIAFADRPEGSVLAVVPPGTTARIRSTGTRFQMLRGTGRNGFTVPLMRDGSGASRCLAEADLIELTNPAGAWWQRAWVVVGDPATNSITGIDGAYELSGLAAGRQEIVVRVPHPGVRNRDRNPDVGAIARMWYEPMIEVRLTVDVPATGSLKLDIPVDLSSLKAP